MHCSYARDMIQGMSLAWHLRWAILLHLPLSAGDLISKRQGITPGTPARQHDSAMVAREGRDGRWEPLRLMTLMTVG